MYGQLYKDSAVIAGKKNLPVTIYISPVLDGASCAVEYSFLKRFALNLYAMKRKSDNSIYYGTKINENLTEIMLKMYFSDLPSKKFKAFIGPCLGSRKIVYDENFNGFRRDFIIAQTGDKDLKAKAKYVVPFYFGFDYKSKRGLIFEYAAGISFQQSSGNIFIRGPITTPYSNQYNLRSRFLFGYQF